MADGLATAENFGFTKLENGAITTSWNGEMSADESVLFTAYFHAKMAGDLKNSLSINSKYTPVEAYNQALETLDIQLQFSEDKGIIFKENAPNPFAEKTVFEFELPIPATAYFTIEDISGKVIFSMEKEGVKGKNEWFIFKNDLANAGMYFYRMEVLGKVFSGKMVKI